MDIDILGQFIGKPFKADKKKKKRNRDTPVGEDIISCTFTADSASHFISSHLAPAVMLLSVAFSAGIAYTEIQTQGIISHNTYAGNWV